MKVPTFFLVITLMIISSTSLPAPKYEWDYLLPTRGREKGVYHGLLSLRKPGSRSGSAIAGDGVGVYVYGGEGYDADFERGIMNDLWFYESGTWSWLSGDFLKDALPDYEIGKPGARTDSKMVMDSKGRLFLYGGYGTDPFGILKGYMGDMWRYDGKWIFLGGFKSKNQLSILSGDLIPGSRRRHSMVVDSNDDIWIFGGEGYGNTRGYLCDMWSFSSTENSFYWMNNGALAASSDPNCIGKENELPSGRYGQGMTILGKDIYMFGGWGIIDAGQGILNDFWKFSTDKSVWSEISPKSNGDIPLGRINMGMSILEGEFLVILGGDNSPVHKPYQLLDDVWIYNISENFFIQLARNEEQTQSTLSGGASPGQREFQSTPIINGRSYTFGGLVAPDREPRNDLWRINFCFCETGNCADTAFCTCDCEDGRCDNDGNCQCEKYCLALSARCFCPVCDGKQLCTDMNIIVEEALVLSNENVTISQLVVEFQREVIAESSSLILDGSTLTLREDLSVRDTKLTIRTSASISISGCLNIDNTKLYLEEIEEVVINYNCFDGTFILVPESTKRCEAIYTENQLILNCKKSSITGTIILIAILLLLITCLALTIPQLQKQICPSVKPKNN